MNGSSVGLSTYGEGHEGERSHYACGNRAGGSDDFPPCLSSSRHRSLHEEHPVAFNGTVTEFNWANPHVQIYFDVKDSKGNVAHWSVETLSPGKLARSGWSKDSLKPGDQITITVWAAKSGAPVGFMRKLVLAGGKELSIDEKAN